MTTEFGLIKVTKMLKLVKSIVVISVYGPLAAVSVTAPVTAAPWEDVIPDVAALGTSYIEEAERLFGANFEALTETIPDASYQGSIESTLARDGEFIEFKERHECGILGRMLGVPELVVDYEQIVVPDPVEDISREYIVDLWAAGKSFESWADQATKLVAQDLEEKVRQWNEECVPSVIPGSPLFFYSSGPGYADFPTLSYVADDLPIPEVDTEGWSDWSIERSLPNIQAGLRHGADFAGRYSVIRQSYVLLNWR